MLYKSCAKCFYYRREAAYNSTSRKVCLYCYDTGYTRGEIKDGRLIYADECDKFEKATRRKQPFHERGWGK